MKKLFVSLFFFSGFTAGAQSFTTEARIEYEKTVNMRKLMAKSEMPEQFKESMPEQVVSYYDLIFKENKGIFQKGRDTELKNNPVFLGQPPDERKVFHDYNTGMVTQKKSITWKDFFIQDTSYRINWRITMDTRVIAGYECRRATAVVFDSVFVVAFYTDEITGNGGPESFGGLPGMILGLVIPRIHTSWYATTVRKALLPKEQELLQAPQPGKKTKVYTYRQLSEKIHSDTKNWTWEASNNHKYLWNILW